MSDDNIRPIRSRQLHSTTEEQYEQPPPPDPEEWARIQREIEQQERIRLARELLATRPHLTVAESFALADEFADEALRRLPHPPLPSDPYAVRNMTMAAAIRRPRPY